MYHRTIITRFFASLLILGTFFAPALSFAASRTTPFSVGETLDPGASGTPCGPTDSNCFPGLNTLQPIGTSSGQTGVMKFMELLANGVNSIGFRAPDAITSDTLWTLPASDGTVNQVLATDGNGVLSWVNQSGAGGSSIAGYFTATTTTATSSFAGGITGPGSFTIQQATGNVGIGTTSPYAKLSVAGNVVADAFNATSSVGYQLGGVTLLTASSAVGNTFVGLGSGTSTTSGVNNTFMGYQSGQANTTGGNNTANGALSLFSNTTGTWNTALGAAALRLNTTGLANTAIGYNALNVNTTGSINTASGMYALLANTSGSYNTANGYYSLGLNTTGASSTALGYFAGFSNTTGSQNTFIGMSAGYTDGTTATLSNLTNATAIGYKAQVQQSNSLILGGTGAYGVNVGIGTTTPAASLTLAGASGQTANLFTVASSTGSNLFTINPGGKVSITANGTSAGVTVPLLNISGSKNAGSGAANPLNPTASIKDILTVNPSVDDGDVFGNLFQTSYSGSVDYSGSLIGATHYVNNTVAKTLSGAYGSYDWVENGSSGTTTNLYGSYSRAYNANLAPNTVTNAYAFYGSVNGGFSFPNTITNGYGLYLNMNDANITNPYAIYTAGVTKSYFGGNVGIGTTSPYAKLSVAGSVVADSFNATSTTATSTFTAGVNVGGGNGYFVGGSNVLTLNASSNFSAGPSNNISSGFSNIAVGIGNTSSSVLSTAFGYSNSASGINSVALGNTNTSSQNTAVAVGLNNTASAAGSVALGSSVTNSIANSLMVGPSDTAKLTILSTGYVGIGTTTPASRLTVQSSTGGPSNFTIASTTGASMFNVDNTGRLAITRGTGLNGFTQLGGLSVAGTYSFGNTNADPSTPFGNMLSVITASPLSADGDYYAGTQSRATYSSSFSSSGGVMGSYNEGRNVVAPGQTLANVYGAYNYANNSVSIGATTNSYGSYNLSSTIFSPTTNSYGVYAQLNGAATNGYGVYIDNQSGATNNYSLYASGGAQSYFGGNVGIGTTSPYAKLSVVGQVVADSFNATSTTATSTFAGGVSAGTGNNGYWIGPVNVLATNATAASFNTISGTAGNFAVGTGNTVTDSAIAGLAIGISNTANATVGGFAVGKGNTAGGTGASIAFGLSNTANGVNFSSAFGYSNTSSGGSASAFGTSNITTAQNSSAVGYKNLASGNTSSAFGASSTASALFSSAFGYNNISSAQGAIAIGSNITNNIASSTMIGPSDAAKLTILGASGSVGYVGIGTTSPYAMLSVAGNVVADSFNATSTTATSTFMGDLAIGSTGVTGARLSITKNSTATTAGSEFGASITVSDTGVTTSGTDDIYGLRNMLTHSGATAGTNNAYGVYNNLSIDDVVTGTSKAYGVYTNIGIGPNATTPDISYGSYASLVGATAYGSKVLFDNSAGVSSGYGMDVNPSAVNGIGITSAYGVNFGNFSNATNVYGLYVADQGPTATHYGVYTAGNTKSYFGGNVGIGTTSPYAALSVVGEVVGSYFTATSTTATSTFANNVSIGSAASYRIGGVPILWYNAGSGGQLNVGANINTSSGVTLGHGNTSSNSIAGAVGDSNIASGLIAQAFGYSNNATSTFSTAFGVSNNAGGVSSAAFGVGNSAYAANSVAIGTNVQNNITNSVMIGVSDSAKLTILSNGNVGIGTTSPNGTLNTYTTLNTTNQVGGLSVDLKGAALPGGNIYGNKLSYFGSIGSVPPATNIYLNYTSEGTSCLGCGVSKFYGSYTDFSGSASNGTKYGYYVNNYSGIYTTNHFFANLADGANDTAYTASSSGSFTGSFLKFTQGTTTPLIVTGAGNVGIGTSTPNQTLTIQGTAATETINNGAIGIGDPRISTAAALTLGYNTNYSYIQGWGSKPLALNPQGNNIGIGSTTPFSKLTIATGDIGAFNGAICADNGGLAKCYGALTAGTVYGDGSSFVASDVAENYPVSDETIAAGDIVMLAGDLSDAEKAKRASDRTKLDTLYKDETPNSIAQSLDISVAKAEAGSGKIFGVISTKPGVLLGDTTGLDLATSFKPVALSGRVPLKVNLENGPITKGDQITISSVPGVGAKATATSSVTVATALEDFTSTSATGTILAFVNLTHNDAGLQLEHLVSLTASSTDNTDDTSFTARFFTRMRSWLGDTANGISAITANIFRGKEFHAEDKLCVGKEGSETCVTKEQLDQLLQNQMIASPVSSQSSGVTPPVAQDATTTSTTTETTTDSQSSSSDVASTTLESTSEATTSVSTLPEDPATTTPTTN